jgi:inosose dehydratase
MSKAEWDNFISRFRDVSRMGSEEYGLTVSLHPHAAGFMDFEAEVERLWSEIEPALLKTLP